MRSRISDKFTVISSATPLRPDSFHSIDMLRGLAALAVCLSHFCVPEFFERGFALHFSNIGHLGVMAFFVVSGFVISLQLHQRNFRYANLGQFMKNRIIRLYPACAASIFLAGFIWKTQSMVMPETTRPDLSAWALLNNFLLTGKITGVTFYNVVVWTLAVELQYYLLLALSFPLLFAKSKVLKIASITAWIAVGWIPSPESLVFKWTPLFAIGIALYQGHFSLLSKLEAWTLIILGIISTAFLMGAEACVVTIISIGIISLLRRRSWQPLIYLGTISYSFYLFHAVVGGKLMTVGHRFLGGSPWMFAVLLLAIVVSIGFAHVCYLLIELPSHNWSKLAWKREPKNSGSGPASER